MIFRLCGFFGIVVKEYFSQGKPSRHPSTYPLCTRESRLSVDHTSFRHWPSFAEVAEIISDCGQSRISISKSCLGECPVFRKVSELFPKGVGLESRSMYILQLLQKRVSKDSSRRSVEGPQYLIYETVP